MSRVYPPSVLLVVVTLSLVCPARGGPPPTHTKDALHGTEPVRTDFYGDPLPPGALARLGTGRLCQPFVNLLTFSPDARLLFAAGMDRSFRVWDVGTGKEFPQFQQPGKWMQGPGTIIPLALSPDGKTFVSWIGSTLHLWDWATGQPVRELVLAPPGGAVHIAFSLDGRYLALFGQDGAVYRWDLLDSKPAKQWPAFRYPQALAFSHDGKTLITVGREQLGSEVREFRVYESATGNEQVRHQLKIDLNSYCTISPDGKIVTIPAWGGSPLVFWDPIAGKELQRILGPAGRPWFSGDSQRFATGSADGTIRVWETATGKLLHQFRPQFTAVHRIVLSADGKLLACASRQAPITNHDIHLWDLAKGKEMHSFQGHRTGPLNAAFSADGKRVVTMSPQYGEHGESNWSVRQWDPLSGRQLRTQPIRLVKPASWSTLSPDGTLVALITPADRTLHLWNVTEGEESRQWPAVRPVSSLTFSWDSKSVLAPDHLTIYRWDVMTGKEDRLKRPADSISSCLPVSGNSWLFITAESGGLLLFDAATGRELRRFPGRLPGPVRLALSPDGRTVAAEAGNVIRTWEIASGGERWHVTGETNSLFSALVFSPDGRTLAAGHRYLPSLRQAIRQDPTVRLWQLPSGEPLPLFEGHRSAIQSIAFSPDSRLLVSAGDENTALVWDARACTATEKSKPIELSPRDLETLWSDLAREDAAQAYHALGRLAAAPQQAVSFLTDRLKPAFPPSKPLDKLIADLDDDRFSVRQKATEELEDLGQQAEVALRRVLAGQPSAEVRLRVEQILGVVTKRLRVCRAVEVLEQLGTPESQHLLRALAGGAPEAQLTQEAKSSLERLAKRPAAMP